MPSLTNLIDRPMTADFPKTRSPAFTSTEQKSSSSFVIANPSSFQPADDRRRHSFQPRTLTESEEEQVLFQPDLLPYDTLNPSTSRRSSVMQDAANNFKNRNLERADEMTKENHYPNFFPDRRLSLMVTSERILPSKPWKPSGSLQAFHVPFSDTCKDRSACNYDILVVNHNDSNASSTKRSNGILTDATCTSHATQLSNHNPVTSNLPRTDSIRSAPVHSQHTHEPNSSPAPAPMQPSRQNIDNVHGIQCDENMHKYNTHQSWEYNAVNRQSSESVCTVSTVRRKIDASEKVHRIDTADSHASRRSSNASFYVPRQVITSSTGNLEALPPSESPITVNHNNHQIGVRDSNYSGLQPSPHPSKKQTESQKPSAYDSGVEAEGSMTTPRSEVGPSSNVSQDRGSVSSQKVFQSRFDRLEDLLIELKKSLVKLNPEETSSIASSVQKSSSSKKRRTRGGSIGMETDEENNNTHTQEDGAVGGQSIVPNQLVPNHLVPSQLVSNHLVPWLSPGLAVAPPSVETLAREFLEAIDSKNRADKDLRTKEIECQSLEHRVDDLRKELERVRYIVSKLKQKEADLIRLKRTHRSLRTTMTHQQWEMGKLRDEVAEHKFGELKAVWQLKSQLQSFIEGKEAEAEKLRRSARRVSMDRRAVAAAMDVGHINQKEDAIHGNQEEVIKVKRTDDLDAACTPRSSTPTHSGVNATRARNLPVRSASFTAGHQPAVRPRVMQQTPLSSHYELPVQVLINASLNSSGSTTTLQRQDWRYHMKKAGFQNKKD